MKALVYGGPGEKSIEERPMPQITAPTDAIVRVLHTTICGTDLHILKGDVPSVTAGRILGHEGMGVVESVGSAVTEVKRGDHVLISCITSCGKCVQCKRQMYSHCADGGWLLGHLIDGTQAEYVRIPHANGSLHKIPQGVDEEAVVMLSDIFPTGYECGVLNGKVKPGDSIAIIGSGPIGLAALLTAKFYSPFKIIVIDVDDARLSVAQRLGATHTINSAQEDAALRVEEITDGIGVDTAIEAVGIPATFELCEDIIAPGGVIANIGVHGHSAELHLEKLWDRNVTITTRLVDTVTTPLLMLAVDVKKIQPDALITHRFPFSRIMDAYDTFSRAEETSALKVIINT